MKLCVALWFSALVVTPSAVVMALCPEATEDDLYPYPEMRYTEWNSLPQEEEAYSAAVNDLGYDEYTWNLPGTAEIESLSYETIGLTGFLGIVGRSQQEAIQDLCLTELTWDCYMNHYSDYTWEELLEEEVQGFYQTLGWTKDNWESDNEEDYPASENKDWSELSDEEKTAADELCYFEETWDEQDLSEWSRRRF
jgi:hypothetical protein